MIDEEKINQEITDLGLEAPRIKPEDIDAAIKSEDYHVFHNSMLTVCCLTLQNGFNVIGTSACVSPENFNKKLGEEISRRNAREQIWALEGYLLKEKLAILLATDTLG